MIEAFTGTQVRAAEEPLLAAGHGDLLMRRAAKGLACVCEAQLRTVTRRGLLAGSSAVVLVGTGNNGGDGLWAGTFLRERGVQVTAVLTGDKAHAEALAAFRRAGGTVFRLGGPGPSTDATQGAEPAVADVSPVGLTETVALLCRVHLVVDAVLGTGASGGLRGEAAELVRAFERARDGCVKIPRIVACDVVSGVSVDTGEVDGPVLRADATVSFGAAKVGHVVAPGEQVRGELTVIPIGIEGHLGAPSVHRPEPADTMAHWPRPISADTKYTRGVVGVVAGTSSYPGAAVMSTTAAIHTGAGMVRFLGDSTTSGMVLVASPEAVCSDAQPWDVHVQAWLAGPGVVSDHGQLARVQAVIEAAEPAVLDAGALTLAAQAAVNGPLGAHKILTPHAGELRQIFEWLQGFEMMAEAPQRDQIEAAPFHWVREAARLTGATVLLKGATTVIASPVTDGAEPVCVSVGGASPWLATAGSGDTLAGILGTVVAHVAEHPDALRGLGEWARNRGRWAAAAALGASVHALASRMDGDGPVPPTVLAANVRRVLRRSDC